MEPKETGMGQLNGHLLSIYSAYIDRTRSGLYKRVARAPAGDALHKYFERGKMMRAFLVFASSASVGGDPEDVIKAAEAIELLHTASLIHDDIIDQASERRGLASLHERLGVGSALILGDDLILRAFAALAETRACHPIERVFEAMEAMNRLARECCRGQFDEMHSGRWISEDKYFAIIRAKTAAPFIAAGEMGTILAGGTIDEIARIRIYAQHIGVAFQIADDLLDLFGDSHILGKPVRNSLLLGRPLLPLIYLWQIGSDSVREEMSRLKESGWPRQELVGLLEENGILDRVGRVQARHIAAAIFALKGYSGASGVNALRALAARVTAMASSQEEVFWLNAKEHRCEHER